MMEYKIVFLDIDGTILRPDHTIETSTKESISELKAKGMEVVLATGRPLHELESLAAELKIDSFITYNGSYVVYKNEEIFKEYFAPNIIESFLDIAERKNHELVFHTSSHNLTTNMHSQKVIEFLRFFDLTKNKPFSPEQINQVLSATVIANHPDDHKLYPLFDKIFLSQVNVNGMRHCFDILIKNINKGTAVKKLLEHLHIPRGQAIAFGDGLNDKEMLAYVGESFAMENAHPDLFKYAKHVTTSVNESGVYNGLKMLGLLS
jgi:Cof subfamily protein (haloacid dehalogenase superfamily)